MAKPTGTPEFDVVIIGSGFAGALVADRLTQKKDSVRVLILEAGDFVPEVPDRIALVQKYETSSSKSQSYPYVDFAASQPNDAKRAILRREGFEALGELVAAEAEEVGASAVGGLTMGADPVACAALAAGRLRNENPI